MQKSIAFGEYRIEQKNKENEIEKTSQQSKQSKQTHMRSTIRYATARLNSDECMRAFDVIEKFGDQKHQKRISVNHVKGWVGSTLSETDTNLFCVHSVVTYMHMGRSHSK